MSGVHILHGLDKIVNPDNIRAGVDVRDLEEQLINGGMMRSAKADTSQANFARELNEIAKHLDLSLEECGVSATAKPAEALPTPPPPPSSSATESLFRTTTPVATTGAVASLYTGSSSAPAASASAPAFESVDVSSLFGGATSAYKDSWGNGLQSRTQEQERRTHIESIMRTGDTGAAGGAFSFEREKREDQKCHMLAEIDSLSTILAEDGVDLSRVPKVDMKSSFDEINDTLKTLRHKNDSARYCSFAEEFLIFGACNLEEIFNGERTWFNKYKPDLTGWNNHVSVKLRRMRHDTSQVVADVMRDYAIGPGLRILLELIPSMVIYSRRRKQQVGQTSVFSDAAMQQSTKNIRDLA